MTVTDEPADIQGVCNRAAEIIRERGWCQHEMRSEDGRVSVSCAIHDAITEFYGWQPYPNLIFEAAKAITLARSDFKPRENSELAYAVALIIWNDSSKTTAEEIIAALEGTT